MNKNMKKLIGGFADFGKEQEEYYKAHPEELKYLVKAMLDDFNEDPTFDEGTFLKVLLRIAKLHGMTKVAKKAEINRVSLYKALGPNANPSFKTFTNITQSLGIKINFTYCGK